MTDTELTSGDFTESAEPFRLFAAWLDDATKSEPNDPNGLALATVDEDGMPDVRMVLLKGFDEQGFVFYTNFESAKGREILSSMKAAMCFHWKSLRRQVRVRGPVEVVERRRGRRLFQDAPARQPHRRLGLETVAAAGKPLRAGKGGGGIHGEICDRRDTAAEALVGFSPRAEVDRVLARPAVQIARPDGVHADERGRLGEDEALSVGAICREMPVSDPSPGCHASPLRGSQSDLPARGR